MVCDEKVKGPAQAGIERSGTDGSKARAASLPGIDFRFLFVYVL